MESTSTMHGTVVINGGEPMDAVLVKRQEMIEYRSNIARKADPRWEFTDAAGHFHAYDQSRKNELPTLDARVEHVDCDGSACGSESDCEGYDITHWHCALCGEEIKPGTVPDEYGIIPGRWSFDLTVHGEVPKGRVSFRFTAREVEFFGIAETMSSRAEGSFVRVRVTTEMYCGPVGQRKITPVASRT